MSINLLYLFANFHIYTFIFYILYFSSCPTKLGREMACDYNKRMNVMVTALELYCNIT